MDGEPIIPAPRDDDNDDVAWALQTAAVQWNRGAYSDAVVWLRRAVEAAIVAGDAKRTSELNRLTSSVANRAADLQRAPPAPAPPKTDDEGYEEAEEIESDEVHSDVVATHSAPRPAASTYSDIPTDFDDSDQREPAETIERVIVDRNELRRALDTSDEDDVLPPDRSYLDEETPSEREPHSGPRNHVPEEEPIHERPEDEPIAGESQEGQEDVDDEAPTIPPQAMPAGVDADAVVPAPVAHEDEPPPRETVDTRESEPDFVSEPSSKPSAPPRLETPFDVAHPHFPADSGPPDISFESTPPSLRGSVPGFSPETATGATPSPDERDGSRDDEGEVGSAAPESTLLSSTEKAPSTVESPGPEAAPGETGARPIVDGIGLDQVRGFEDFPLEVQLTLAASARIETLAVDEEVSFFGAALVTRGSVGIMPAIAEAAACVARAGEVVFTRGTLDDGIALRVVALEDDTVVASWETKALEDAMADCPWVADELRSVADRFQALAGATLGPLGDRLDDSLRAAVTDRLDVRSVGRDEVIVKMGQTVPGLHIIGAGRVELVANDEVIDELGPGDFLFTQEVMSAGVAQATARAGKGGALLLVAPRSVAHELMVSVPPLLEILAG